MDEKDREGQKHRKSARCSYSCETSKKIQWLGINTFLKTCTQNIDKRHYRRWNNLSNTAEGKTVLSKNEWNVPENVICFTGRMESK